MKYQNKKIKYIALVKKQNVLKNIVNVFLVEFFALIVNVKIVKIKIFLQIILIEGIVKILIV